jgi:hypothetical protein
MATTVCAMRQDKRAQRRQPRAHGSDRVPSRRASHHRQKTHAKQGHVFGVMRVSRFVEVREIAARTQM